MVIMVFIFSDFKHAVGVCSASGNKYLVQIITVNMYDVSKFRLKYECIYIWSACIKYVSKSRPNMCPFR